MHDLPLGLCDNGNSPIMIIQLSSYHNYHDNGIYS